MRFPTRRGAHWWVRRFFFVWAIVSTAWVANKMRTRGVADEMLRTSPTVAVSDGPATLEFRPVRALRSYGLIFYCGAGVSAHAYAPLLRPIAEAGYPVFIIKLPYRFAPFDSHKETAISRARSVIAAHPAIAQWVVSGHSLGGSLTARTVRSVPDISFSMGKRPSRVSAILDALAKSDVALPLLRGAAMGLPR